MDTQIDELITALILMVFVMVAIGILVVSWMYSVERKISQIKRHLEQISSDLPERKTAVRDI
jgi:cell division protein FtsL